MKKVPEKLQSLEDKIKLLHEKEHEVARRNEISPYADAARIGFSITIELISGVLVGACLGYLLDVLLSTKPLFMTLLLLLGGAAGFLNVYHMIKEDEKKKQSDKEQ